MTFLSAETGWKEKVDWKRTNELEVIFGFQLATIQNPRNQFFMRTVQLLQGTTHLQLQAVHVIFTKERERKKQLSLKVNTSWTAKNIISKTTVDHLKKKGQFFVEHRGGWDSPGAEKMLSCSSLSVFNLDVSHRNRSTYAGEDKPPPAAASSASSPSRGPS